MTRLATACLILLAAGEPAHAVPSISVGDAVEFCEAGFPPPDGASASLARRMTCIAYIDGVIATVAQLAAIATPAGGATTARGAFCVPGDTSYEVLSERFVTFARANPQHRDRAAATMFVAAFASSYPCR